MKRSILIAGIAAVALAGTAAWAAESNIHEMTVQLPGGGVEHIQYTGNVAPKVRVVPLAAMPRVAFMPMAFGFPYMARIQAAMNAQMAQMNTMMRQADAMAAKSFANGPIAISNGGHGYFCAHSVQITTDAHGKQNVVEHSAGDCGGARSHVSAPAAHPAPAKGTPI
ncbi:MAG TPA: hypothetical protein VGG36_06555 [Rhizomicrobium sp.]|jgi:hypothetical protein